MSLSLLKRLRLPRLPFTSADADAAVPFWEERPPRASAPASRLRVLWTGSQVAPVPHIVRDPPPFDPTR